MRILAVDDESSILELLSKILASFGYSEVVTAANGQDALDKIASDPGVFDCLLLDIQMPIMNGVTLCEKVRDLPEYRYVPIIMLTAMKEKKYFDAAFEAGATDYVTKPFDFDDLQQRLADAHRLADERRASIAVMLELEAEEPQIRTAQGAG